MKPCASTYLCWHNFEDVFWQCSGEVTSKYLQWWCFPQPLIKGVTRTNSDFPRNFSSLYLLLAGLALVSSWNVIFFCLLWGFIWHFKEVFSFAWKKHAHCFYFDIRWWRLLALRCPKCWNLNAWEQQGFCFWMLLYRTCVHGFLSFDYPWIGLILSHLSLLMCILNVLGPGCVGLYWSFPLVLWIFFTGDVFPM